MATIAVKLDSVNKSQVRFKSEETIDREIDGWNPEGKVRSVPAAIITIDRQVWEEMDRPNVMHVGESDRCSL